MLVNAYKSEEASFLKTVKRVNRRSVPASANVISSHVLFKGKGEDDLLSTGRADDLFRG